MIKSVKLFFPAIFFMACFISSVVFAGQANHERRQRETLEFSDGDSLSLTNISGPVRVSAWDRQECEIVAVKTIREDIPPEKARQWFEKVKVEVKKVSGGVEVTTKYPDKHIDLDFGFGDSEQPEAYDEERGIIGSWLARLGSFLANLPDAFSETLAEKYPVEVAYEVRLPRLANVEIDNVLGEVEISGLKGRLETNMVNGTIKLTGSDGRLETNIVSGEIIVESPGGVVELNAVNGSLSVTLDDLERLRRVECYTINGNITLSLPVGSPASIELSALSGGVQLDQGFTFKGEIKQKKVSGVLSGSGGPSIEASAINGSIEVKPL